MKIDTQYFGTTLLQQTEDWNSSISSGFSHDFFYILKFWGFVMRTWGKKFPDFSSRSTRPPCSSMKASDPKMIRAPVTNWQDITMNYLPQWDRGEIIHKPTQTGFHDGTLKKKKVELYLFHLVGVLGTGNNVGSSWCGLIFFSLKGDTLGPIAWILLLFEDAGQEFNEKGQKDTVGSVQCLLPGASHPWSSPFEQGAINSGF